MGYSVQNRHTPVKRSLVWNSTSTNVELLRYLSSAHGTATRIAANVAKLEKSAAYFGENAAETGKGTTI
jgi:hypothetical protein